MNKDDFSFFERNEYLILLLVIFLVLSVSFNIMFLLLKPTVNYKNDENIIFFGDSLVSKYDIEKFYPKQNVVNKGVSGNKTENLLERINRDVYEYNPSKVIVLIGINDLKDNVDQEDILLNIKTIINGIKNNRKYSEIYIQSLYPVNSQKIKDEKLEYAYDLKNEDIKKLNSGLKSLCEQQNVKYINVYPSLIDKNGNMKKMYTSDGLHLSNLGYLKVTSVLKKYGEE